jgi:hypothetical protein
MDIKKRLAEAAELFAEDGDTSEWRVKLCRDAGMELDTKDHTIRTLQSELDIARQNLADRVGRPSMSGKQCTEVLVTPDGSVTLKIASNR